MNWPIFLNTFQAGLAALSLYFIYDLIREYKLFKKETSETLTKITVERRHFEVAVGAARLKIDELKLITEASLKTVSFELDKFKHSLSQIEDKAGRAHSFMKKGLVLADEFNKRSKQSEQEIKSIKIQMGQTTIFKTPK